MVIKIIILIIIIALIWVIWNLDIVKICGDSMEPNLHDGQIKIGVNTHHKSDKVKVGEVYVIKNPRFDEVERYIVKRVVGIKEQVKDVKESSVFENKPYKMIWVEGDNSEVSYDSRFYGYISSDYIISRVLTGKKGIENE